MKRMALTALLAAGVASCPAGGFAAPSIQTLLWEATSPREVRARLLAHASALPDSSREEQGTAFYYAGLSFERDGVADSAIACYEQAFQRRGQPAERDALVDALLLRSRPGDATRALASLRGPVKPVLLISAWDQDNHVGRQSWALYLSGKTDSALALFASAEKRLLHDLNPLSGEWRYRAGLMELEHGNPRRTIDLLIPLGVWSRLKDRDVMGMLKEAGDKLAVTPRVHDMLGRELAARDQDEQALLDAFGARRLSFTAADGFPLGAIMVAPTGATPSRAAVVLLTHDETFESYDSLCVGLRRAGYAIAFLEPRGAGRSVDASCPLPETWRGRESEMHARTALDLRAALNALALGTPVDTSRYLVIGGGAMAATAVEAATLDRRIQLLLLVSPTPAPAELGRMRSRLEATKRPVFFQVGAEDPESLPVAEGLYRSINQRTSRLSDSERIGRGALVFRHDRAALPRLTQWLSEQWPRAKHSGPRP